MHMGVDEPGQQGGVAEIDDLCIVGNLHIAAHRLDLGARDHHHAVFDQLAGHGIEQACGLQHDGASGCGNTLRETRLSKTN